LNPRPFQAPANYVPAKTCLTYHHTPS